MPSMRAPARTTQLASDESLIRQSSPIDTWGPMELFFTLAPAPMTLGPRSSLPSTTAPSPTVTWPMRRLLPSTWPRTSPLVHSSRTTRLASSRPSFLPLSGAQQPLDPVRNLQLAAPGGLDPGDGGVDERREDLGADEGQVAGRLLRL